MKRTIVNLTVNGDRYSVAVLPNATLVEVLRDRLRLTGTKLGCGTGDCGACTVLIDGRAVNSCLTLAVEVDGAEITTVEGIAVSGEELHPLQQAFIERGATQCGFCTPGMVVSGVHLLDENPSPSEAEIRRALAGNICRCTGYTKIVEAIEVAAEQVGGRIDEAAPFEYHAPASLDEVFELLGAHGAAAKLMAGGTDLLPGLKSGKRSCEHVVALKGVQELSGLSYDEKEGLAIGATTLLSEVGVHSAVAAHYPALASAIATLATAQVRHKATVAGNLCNASPCADTATPLLAYGGRAVLVGPEGRREVSLDDFFCGPGSTAVGEREVLERILVPAPERGLRAIFLKFSPRSLVDIAAVNLTLAMVLEGKEIRRVDLCLGTVAPTPMRAAHAEKILRGAAVSDQLFERAALAARGECRPITDFRASAEYKAHLVYVLSRRALQTLSETV